MPKSVIHHRLLTIMPQGGVQPIVIIERWNTRNIYIPSASSMGRVMQLVVKRYPVMKFEYEFPKEIEKFPGKRIEWIGGYPHEFAIKKPG